MGKDRALEATAEALYAGQDFYDKPPYAEYTGHRKDCCRGDARKAVAAYLDSLLGELPEEAVEAAAKAYYDDEPQVRPASDRRDKFGNWLDREPKPWEDYIKEPISDGGADERHYAREMLEAALRSLRQGADR